MQQLKHLSGFVVGASVSTAFVLQMNDIVYSQMRRHIILPFMNIQQKQTSDIKLEDIKDIGSGVASFASQFKPHQLITEGPKSLLTDDSQIQSPVENYFSYINMRKQMESQNKREQEVLEKLQIDKFIQPNLLLQEQNNENEQDIFELAKQRGQRIVELKEMQSNQNEQVIEDKSNKQQKFNKKDYEKLKNMDLKQIISVGTQTRVRKQFKEEDDSINNEMVKVERKKQLQQSKHEFKERQQEIQKMLQNPQGLDYEKIMKLYEEQRLEAKELSKKDKRRLRRLKQKAQEQELQKEQVKIESVSEGFDEQNLDELIK